MFSLQLISDLHLETEASYTSYNLCRAIGVKNLALLGDIGEVAHPGLWMFIESLLPQYERIFFVFGNHEPWGRSYEDAIEKVIKFDVRMKQVRATSKRTVGEFVFLNQTRYDIPETEVTILGCTLFSSIVENEQLRVAQQVHDFNRITDWMISDHNSAYLSDLKWLNEQVVKIHTNEPTREIIVLTHYCPTADPRAQHPRHHRSQLSSAFLTDLKHEECWKSPNVKIWAFGHTHFNCDYVDSTGKRVVTNQKGYAKIPQADFDPEKTLCLGGPLPFCPQKLVSAGASYG